MNAFLITDLHGHNWPIGGTAPNGRNARFQDLLNILDQVRPIASPADLAIFGGDLLHRRHYIPFSLFNTLADAVVTLCRDAEHGVLVSGNHDLEDPDTSALDVFDHVTDIDSVVNGLAEIVGVTYIPFMDDPEQMTRAFAQANPRLPIVSHYAATGCLLENDYFLKSPLPVEMLRQFPRVLFGHVHKPSVQCPSCGYQNAITDGAQPDINECPCGRPNPIVYLGAPMHFDFGDKGPRFVWRWTGHRLTGFPTKFPQFITATYPKIPRMASPGYLRILNVPPSVEADVMLSARKMGWLDVLTVPSVLPPETARAIQAGLIVGEGMLREHVARKAPDLTDTERETIIREGIDIMTEARR